MKSVNKPYYCQWRTEKGWPIQGTVIGRIDYINYPPGTPDVVIDLPSCAEWLDSLPEEAVFSWIIHQILLTKAHYKESLAKYKAQQALNTVKDKVDAKSL